MYLTPKEKKLYSDLVKEYNKDKWSQTCGLDRFLKIKYENSGYLTSYYNVWQYAQNDY